MSPESRRAEALEAIRFHREVMDFTSFIRHIGDQMVPVKPLEGACAVAAERAYEAILLWRTAAAEEERLREASAPRGR